MDWRLLVIPALAFVKLAVAGATDTGFNIELIGNGPGKSEWTVAAGKTGCAKIGLLFQGKPKYPVTIRLICPASTRKCLISEKGEPFDVRIKIRRPDNGSSATPGKGPGQKSDVNSGASPLRIVTLADLPKPADSAEISRALLIATDSEGQSVAKQLVFSFATPSWKYPPGSSKSGPLDLKVGLSGKGQVRVDTNGWEHGGRDKCGGTDKIGVRLSDFVNPTDGTTATIRILDGSGNQLTQDASLGELGYKHGDIELRLDAAALPIGQPYEGTMDFTRNGQPLGYPPPLTLKITRVTPAAHATLIAYPPLAPPDLSTVPFIDVKLQEQSGDLPLQTIQFRWTPERQADEREGPLVDRLDLALVIGKKTYPLWPHRDAGPIDIPAGGGRRAPTQVSGGRLVRVRALSLAAGVVGGKHG